MNVNVWSFRIKSKYKSQERNQIPRKDTQIEVVDEELVDDPSQNIFNKHNA